MALWVRLERPTLLREDRQRHTLQEARKAARRALSATRWRIHWPTDSRRSGAAYSGSDHARQVHQAQACGCQTAGRQMRAELKELETWFVDHGHLDKKWRDRFKITE